MLRMRVTKLDYYYYLREETIRKSEMKYLGGERVRCSLTTKQEGKIDTVMSIAWLKVEEISFVEAEAVQERGAVEFVGHDDGGRVIVIEEVVDSEGVGVGLGEVPVRRRSAVVDDQAAESVVASSIALVGREPNVDGDVGVVGVGVDALGVRPRGVAVVLSRVDVGPGLP